MSRALRKQMFTMINLLEKANKALKVSLTSSRFNEVGIRQLLSDCQETAVTMGNELEIIFGKGMPLVRKLEDYHESLYQMTLVLKHPGKRYELLKELAEQTRQAKKMLDEQIPDRMEVVFFPYKASMWDSMDLIWEASEQDEDCDAYVVPIPYYDRNQDGTFSGYHYEGDELPSHITVTHYENYNLQKHWPDTIFIQNPYDETDAAISVDPRFYSHTLKGVTDTLVYISDFLPDETPDGFSEAVDRAIKLCTAPGTLNADMVIVHSEKMKQVYIDILTQNFGESTRKDWEKKIFSIRSSEIEQLQNHKENEEQ